MNELFEAIKGKKFAVFGRAGIDLFCDEIGIKSENAVKFRSDLGGSSANICTGLVKLGSQASLITSVSDDAVGRFAVNRLRDYGVDTNYVKKISGECRTSLAIYENVIDDFQNVIYRNNAADFQVQIEDVDKVEYGNFNAVITAGTVFASDPSRSSTFHAIKNARQAGLPVIFDIDYRPYSWPSVEVASDVLSRAGMSSDLIVGNDEEFGFMAGDYDLGLDKARELASLGKTVIYKMGEKGAISLNDENEIRTGIFPTKAIKPVGAGDSFMAGLLASIADDFSLEDSVLRGSACAAIVVSKPGCAGAMPTKDELETFLNKNNIQ